MLISPLIIAIIKEVLYEHGYLFMKTRIKTYIRVKLNRSVGQTNEHTKIEK